MAKCMAVEGEKFVKGFVVEADDNNNIAPIYGYESALDLVKVGPVWIDTGSGYVLVTAATENTLTAGSDEYTYAEAE